MQFVNEARQFWRWWSVRLAAVFGVVTGYLTAYPATLQQMVAYVPEYWRPAASVALGLIAFALPTLARLMQQGGKSDG